MALINVSKLVSYAASTYPTIAAGLNVFWTKELRAIQGAITSTQQMLKSAQFGVTKNAGVPTTSILPAGASGIFKDTSGGGVYLVYNDAGTIKKVALT